MQSNEFIGWFSIFSVFGGLPIPYPKREFIPDDDPDDSKQQQQQQQQGATGKAGALPQQPAQRQAPQPQQQQHHPHHQKVQPQPGGGVVPGGSGMHTVQHYPAAPAQPMVSASFCLLRASFLC